MTGKQLLLDAIRGKKTERPAWLPFVGCHGGFLIGKSATEYLQSAELVVAGLKKAKSLYDPDGLPVMFDLQIEAEILGCHLHWADEVPPAVTSHPLAIFDEPALAANVEEIYRVKGHVRTADGIVYVDYSTAGLSIAPAEPHPVAEGLAWIVKGNPNGGLSRETTWPMVAAE